MDILTWGRNPWDQPILTHISWDLLWAPSWDLGALPCSLSA